MKSSSKIWTLLGVILFLLHSVTMIRAGKEKSKHIFFGSSSRSTSPERKLEHNLVNPQASSPRSDHDQKHLNNTSNKKQKVRETSDHNAHMNLNSKQHSKPFQRNPSIDFEQERLYTERQSLRDKIDNRSYREEMDQLLWPYGTENRDQIIHLRDQSMEKENTARRQSLASRLLSKANIEISDVLQDQSIKNHQISKNKMRESSHLGFVSKFNRHLMPIHKAEEKQRQDREYEELGKAQKAMDDMHNRHRGYFMAKYQHKQEKQKGSPLIIIKHSKTPVGVRAMKQK